MTAILEYLEVGNKQLLLKFTFDRVSNKSHRSPECTLDKYMTYESWKDIYARLVKNIDKYVADTSQPTSSEKKDLRRAQLSVTVELKPVAIALLTELGLIEGNVHPHCMCVHVKPLSKIPDYVAKEEKKRRKQKSGTDAYARSKSQPQTDSQSLSDDEYVPTGGMADQNDADAGALEYIPASQGSSHSNDEYTPVPACVNGIDERAIGTRNTRRTKVHNAHDIDADIPIIDILSQEGSSAGYHTPTKNEKSSRKLDEDNAYDSDSNPPHYQHTPRPKRYKVLSPSLSSKSVDIFGDVSEDESKFKKPEVKKEPALDKNSYVTKRIRPEKRVPMSTPKASTQRTIDGWCSKGKSKLAVLSAKDNNNSERKKKSKKPLPAVKKSQSDSDEEYERNHQKQMAIFRAVQDNLAPLTKTVEVDRIINLKHIPTADLIDTYREHENKLFELYNGYLTQKSNRVNIPKDLDYITIHDLMEMNQVHEMVRTLVDRFLVSDDEEPVMQEFFFKIMVPEWALSVMMKLHGMTRVEMVDHIRRQDIMTTQNSESFEMD